MEQKSVLRDFLPYAGIFTILAALSLLYWAVQQGYLLTEGKMPATLARSGHFGLNLNHEHGFHFIRPQQHDDPGKQVYRHRDLPQQVALAVDSTFFNQGLQQGSLYFCDLSTGEWLSIGAEERFHPASLFKVALLISYFHWEESRNGLFRKKLYADPKFRPEGMRISYPSATLPPERYYSIDTLLETMIRYSDNFSARILMDGLVRKNPMEFDALMAEIGLTEPQSLKSEFLLTATEYSRLWHIIYRATYLNEEDSETVAHLLVNTDFNQGFRQGFPPGTRMICKFGEWNAGTVFELHESGIIYFQDRPYILTVMTRGKNNQILEHTLRQISKAVSTHLSHLP